MVVSAAAAFVVPCAGRSDSSLGQLLYGFTYSTNQNTSARDSTNNLQGIGSQQGSGASQYTGSLSDKGTIAVSVIGKEQDGGLVVNVSEQGQDTRRAPPATCVVYGNTNVICDPNKTVYVEEYTLLRFLGPNFVDPDQLDAKRHWAITQNNGGTDLKANYTINSNVNGIMQIGETRSLRGTGGGSLTTDVQTKLGYDFNRSVPTSVEEYVTQRRDNGVVGTSTTIYQTTLNLISDTMAKK